MASEQGTFFLRFSRMKLSIGIILLIVLFFAGAFLGYRFHTASDPEGESLIYRENNPKYPFINPLLGVDYVHKGVFVEYEPLYRIFKSYITQHTTSDVSQISAYFRDLDSGHWTGVNEDIKFAPASMLKVVIMMAYFRNAELDPSLLTRPLYFSGAKTIDMSTHYPPSHPLQANKFYTPRELISRMIMDSDNDAKDLLVANINSLYTDSIFSDLHLPDPPPDNVFGDFMSAKDYSRVFRVLYSSTFFSRNVSESVLEMLSKTNFPHGLAAGVPTGVPVSHKFGERQIASSSGSVINELHDCGIVYYSDSPYFLCVMTKGARYADLEKIIADISHEVYTQVDTMDALTRHATEAK